MTQFQSGTDALNALNATNEGGNANKTGFSSFKSGTSYKVRVLGVADLIRFYSYGVFGKINSFVAKSPSVKNAKGFAVENLTSWDMASKYYQDLKFKAQDTGNAAEEKEHGDLAYKFRVKERYALGFINLEDGEPIIIDLSKKQAQTIHAVIKKYEKKLGKIAFELSKHGNGQGTTVSLSPIIDADEDLSDKERENFAKVDGATFDMTLFENLLYEADEKEMTENLVAAGFDISLIGLSIGGEQGGIGTEETVGQYEF